MLKKIEEHDISDKELSGSYWLVTHWEKIRRVATIFLGCVAGVVWLFVVGNIIILYLRDFKEYRAMVSSFSGMLSRAVQAPLHADISLSGVTVVPAGESRFDVLAMVTNPNVLWRAKVEYTLFQGTKAVYHGQALVYPTQTRPLISPSVSSASVPTVRLELTKVAWYRMSMAEKEGISQRQNFLVKNVAPITTADDPRSTLQELSRVAFTVTNDTIYNYWEVEVPVVLKAGGQVVAVYQVWLDKLAAGETRKVFASWATRLPTIDGYDIAPQVDVFDPGSTWFSEKPLQKLEN